MTDVGKIPGEKGPRRSEDPKRKKNPDSESFREMMKVGKVRETDPDEQSKKKNQAEAEEDFAAEQTGSPLNQGLGSEAPPPPFLSENDSGPQINSDRTQVPDNLPPSQAPPISQGPIELPQHSESTEVTQGATRSRTHETKKKTEAKPKEAITKTTKKPKANKGEKTGKPLESVKIKSKEKKQKPAILPSAKQEIEVEKPKKKAKEVAQQIEGISGQPLPTGGWEATKEAEKKEKTTPGNIEVEAQTPDTQTAPQPAETQATPPPAASPFANLPPQVARVFERMVGVMTVMQHSGITKTTVTLDNSQYAKSVFFGAQIEITEFSTAPLEYNIKLSGNQQALDLMGANSQELVAAFQAGKYNFKVHRFELSQRPLVGEAKRKEAQKVKRKKTGGS